MGWANFTVMPGSQDPFGNDIIAGHYAYCKADLLITLADVFMMDPNALQGLNVAHWLPVDCDPMGAMDAERVRALSPNVIAMSQFGQRMMQDAGFNPMYVPHGIDVQEFRPAQDRDGLRQQLGFEPGTFLIGLNAANKDGPRKAISEQMQAFALFHKKYPNSKFLIHSIAQPKAGGVDIKTLADVLGIADAIMLPDQYALACGLMGRPMLANWYGVLDLMTNCAYGEGFGLPIIEAQACGTPVVVTDWSTMSELCGSGWKVSGERYWVAGHNSWWMRPNIEEMAEYYETAYELWQDGQMGPMRKAAREFAMQYDADAVLTKYWKPVLDELDEKRPKVTVLDLATRERLELPAAEESGERRDLLVIVPSRGRPDNVRRLVEAVTATSTAQTDIIFAFDDDDPELDASIEAAGASEYIHGERMNLVQWTNKIALEKAKDYYALASIGDDHVPRTPGWDTQLLLALQAGNAVAYPNDMVRDDIPEAIFARSEAAEALGWLLEPELHHFFVDNVWAEMGKHGHCIAYLPDVIVEHMHHLRKKEIERDKTYRESEARFMHDKGAFEQWRANRMTADMAKIKAVLQEPVHA